MQPQHNRGRILVCKVGLDGHDRGAKVLARMLEDEGFDVRYLGVRSTAAQVAAAAEAEDVDVVAVSLLSGAHLTVARNVRQALDDCGLGHVPIAMGGLIPGRDAEALRGLGLVTAFCRGHAESAPEKIPGAMDELVSLARRPQDVAP